MKPPTGPKPISGTYGGKERHGAEVFRARPPPPRPAGPPRVPTPPELVRIANAEKARQESRDPDRTPTTAALTRAAVAFEEVKRQLKDESEKNRLWREAHDAKHAEAEREGRSSGRKTFWAAVATPIATVIVALIVGFFGLQQTREQMKAQTPERARAAVEGEVTEKIAVKTAKLALEAHDRTIEPKLRQMVKDITATQPIPREIDMVTATRRGAHLAGVHPNPPQRAQKPQDRGTGGYSPGI